MGRGVARGSWRGEHQLDALMLRRQAGRVIHTTAAAFAATRAAGHAVVAAAGGAASLTLTKS